MKGAPHYRVVITACLVLIQCIIVASLGFTPGWEYWYDFEATTHIKDAATIFTSAKVGIIPVNNTEDQTNLHQLCRLTIQNYYVDITEVSNQVTENPSTDFTKCLLFDMNEFGEVLSVYYEPTEDPSVLSAKKTILDVLSAKLVTSKSQVEKGQRWGYATNETGHEGPHSAVYQAEPSGSLVNFLKTKTTKPIQNAKHTHTKKIAIHEKSHVPHDFHTEDEFSTPEDSMLQGEGADPAFAMTLPLMSSHSSSRLKLHQTKTTSDYAMMQSKADLLQTTLKADVEPIAYYNLSEAKEMIVSNLPCVHKYKGSHRSIPCFRDIVLVLQRVSLENLETLCLSYKDSKDWIVIIDALGAAGSVDCLYLLAREVIGSKASLPEEIMHALIHLVQLNVCPPELLLSELFWRGFHEPWSFSDEHVSSQVNDRTKLVVGAMVSMVIKCNQTWAEDVIHRLESLVGVHDPFHHREMRSTMTQKEMRVHLSVKSVHIYALGNAGQTSSYDYFASYLNTTESHMQLRFSAVEAVANYQHSEAAELLLQVALTDEEDNVRRNAILAYKRHPHGGGDLKEFVDQELYRFSNITDIQHKRMRRGIKEIVGRIWKGFHFQLKTPSMDWKKKIGGKNVGAEFGVIIKNEMNIAIAPLSGHLKVDVHDGAWASIHVGILSINLDIVRAELCFKGKVEYDLNIFGEYGFEDLKALADIYNNNIKKVVEIVKNSIENFKHVQDSWKGFSVGDIWLDFVDSVKALPKDVQNLRKVARRVLRKLEEYVDLLPGYTLIRDFGHKVVNLFNDIKTDVMTMYNSIVDIISTTIPWAWDEIRAALNDIIDAFRNILKGPKTAIQNIGRGTARISAAIAAVLDAKDKLVEAFLFDKENRPYWFDFDKVLGDLWKDTKEIKRIIEETVVSLQGTPNKSDDIAYRYTGVDLKTMKMQALSEIWKILEEDMLQGPLEHMRRFLNPFLQTYQYFTETVQNIKNTWLLLIEGYQEARTLLDLVFGPKINKAFPRKYLVSKTCGEGFWESTGKNKYKHTGVDLEVAKGTLIVAPFNGYIHDTSEFGKAQVTLDVDDLKNTQIIIDNVKLDPDLNHKQVGAGDVIGTVTNPRWCLDGHVHLSMRKTNVTGDYINPSRYMERRKMPPPKWREECDHYKLVWLGKTISSGLLTKDPQLEDKTPDVPNEPDSSEVNLKGIADDTRGRKKRATFDNIVDKLENFTKTLGLPGFDKLKEIFSLKINDVTLGMALDYMDDFGLSKMKDKIIKLLLKVEKFVNQETCANPNFLDDNELKAALTLRKKSTSGARQTLINRYQESETKCFGLKSRVTNNIYCSYQSDCLGLSCCLDLEFFIYKYAMSAFVRYDPCIGSMILGVGKWTKVIEVTAHTAAQDIEPINDDVNVLDVAQLLVHYKVKLENSVVMVSLGVRWCSTQFEECQEVIEIIKDAQFNIAPCDESTSDDAVSKISNSPTVNLLMNTNMADVIKLVEFSGLSEDELNSFTEYLREAFQTWLKKQIENAMAQIFGDEFARQDLCLEGYSCSFGPYSVTIFESPPIRIPAGPVAVVFEMGLKGYYGAEFRADACVLSMKLVARLTPRVGSEVWGSLSVKILIFGVKLQLTGYVLTTSFPTKAEFEFSRFPLELRARMDLELIPLKIDLYVEIEIKIKILFISLTKTIFDKKLWGYQSESINKNIFNLNDAEPDNTPPDFSWYSKAECRKCGNRTKRWANEETPRCVVYQVVGRDYRDPAYVIELAVEDDKSPVNMTYCVGTYNGGCDIVKDKALSGTTTVTEKLYTGQRLYFKITARNNAGMAAYSTCELPTYDMTLPTGRVIPAFKTSSHPDKLMVSVLLTEDSVLTDTKISAGYGADRYGFQIIDWQDFTLQNDDDTSYLGNDPLTKFQSPKEGKLPWQPFFRKSHDEAEVCARACLAYPPSKCQGFNYDYHANGLCELLNIVEGEVELHKSSLFYYYERRGIGKVATFDFKDLQLQHNKLVFFNVYMKNNLDYTNILSSEGVLLDLTTPFPGYIQNATIDETSVEPCTAFTPDYLHQRCSTQTTIPNYRFIKDGKGSRCVHNGPVLMFDEMYTRANRMSAANWDGFHDNETGILMYTWSVGREPCGFDIHPHNDPHKHLPHESEWTHVGVAYPLDLEDNTAPVIHEVGQAAYDELTEEITITLNASDELSLIKAVEFGLGQSRRDTYILEWQDIDEYMDISYVYRVPDGIPVWVKIRVTNNVELKTVGHAPKALFVDLSPPIPGTIYMGNYTGYHRLYQWESDSLCVVWEGFHDPDSGISEYQIAAGTSPNSEDIKPFTVFSYTAAGYCFGDLHLQHNTKYYVSLVAFNGATEAKNVSSTSQGILVDLTAPETGSVKDGLPDEFDIVFSSDPAMITASWEGFSDPESGLDTSQVDVHRRIKGSTESVSVHHEVFDPNTQNEMELHHMHFYHGDEVHVSYRVTNRAGSHSEARSDGFTVDLTEPVMYSFVDGYNTDVNMEYTSSLTELVATWNFKDTESGIVHFRFSAYSKFGGRTTLVYPSDDTHKELEPSITTWTTDEPLTLIPGGFYYIRIAALNGAGLTAVHDTNGLIVDPSAPMMLYTHAGVLAGQTEEVIDGYVWQNNLEGILGSWKAIDPESGIIEYRVSIGTAKGDDSILSATSVGAALDKFFENLNLEITDPESNALLYYINVVAINGARISSDVKSSSPIRVVEADQTGIVWDGAGLTIREDTSYMLRYYSVTLHFSGFESELNGISHYMWALGTCPMCDNVKVFSDYGIITGNTNARGLGSSGKAQEILELDQGVTYYATVRAITGDRSVLDSSTDGFTVDFTSPQVSLSLLGSITDEDYTDVPVVYRQSRAVEIHPEFVDPESSISEAWLSVGSYKGGHDITDRLELNDSTVLLLEARDEGHPTYFSVTAQNNCGLTSSGFAPVLVVDQTEPEAGQLSCPLVITTNDVTCSWSGILDNESGIDKYLFGIGSAEGIDNIIGFSEISRYDTSVTVANNGEFALTHNAVYYASLATINNVGLASYVYSNTMRVDNTPPISGWIIELQDFTEVDVALQTAFNDFSDITENFDIVCQRDVTKMEIAWQEFIDKETGIDHYDVALGFTPGGTQIHDFVRVEGHSLRYTFYPVDLSAVRQVFASVRGFNTVGLFSVAVSKGVYISRHSSGLPPLSTLLVLDGKEIDDIDYQYDNDRLYAHWDLGGDPCPVVSMNWTIYNFDGTQTASSQMIPTEAVFAEEDGILLKDGDSFFVELRVTNALGYSYSIHSDGLTIQLQPLLPGNVRDGQMIGVDLDFQPSTDTLSANWDGFGSDKDPQTFSDYIGDGISPDIKPHQEISHYEVAIGTDRRYPSTRNDIHPFINVGLNKTWTFQHLELIPKTSYYYITVRAYSLSTTMVEVTSNGIRVGYGGHIVALGEILMNDYVTTPNKVSFSWSDFEFVVPLLHYHLGLKAGTTDMNDILDCCNMVKTDGNVIKVSQNFTSMFDVYPLTGVGLDTFIQLTNLSLDQGASYTAFVVAMDESGTCATVGRGFGVDVTPPRKGNIGLGPDLDLAVLYVPSTEELTVWWEGYTDPESGLMEYDISLMLGSDCDNFDRRQMTTVVDGQPLAPTSTNFTYLQLTLQIGQPYYIILEVTNNAGLTTQTVSRPIIVDIAPPTSGSVIDGTDYQHDLLFHGEQTRFEGRILYSPDAKVEACPYRRYPMTNSDNVWNHIIHKGMWTLPSGKPNSIVFLDKQVSYDSNGVTITMENDITTEHQVLSGAIYADADIAHGALYEFEIKAAGEMYAVTAVTVVDWNKGIMSDFYSIIMSGDEEEDEVTAGTVDNTTPRYKVVIDALDGDTYLEEYSMERQLEGNSFGFHIVKDQDGVYHVILWALTLNSSRTLDFPLDYDPTTDFHTYSLLINDGDIPLTMDDWSVKLLIDSQYRGDIAGISAVGQEATVVLGLYNNHGLMDETKDVFDAPETLTIFRNLRFSAASEELCRYGSPFIGGDHPIVEFHAGIGSEAGLDDVVTFQRAAQPCIPCMYPCDDKICDPDCDPSKVQLIEIVLDALQLEPADDIQMDNITLPAPYYLSVKGITGSGKVALASSNGFYVDVTPPVIGEIFHIDLSWNDYEPSEYQGSNCTIGAYFEVTEDESMIQQYHWAIGTQPFGTDIQEFVDAGTNEFVQNENLEGVLDNHRTYYVTIQAVNFAGLMATSSSQGITTLFDEPDVSDAATSVEGTTPIGDPDTSNTVETSSQTSIEFSWESPPSAQIETTHCGVGTTENESDIFPETPCGLNNSGSISISSEGIGMNDDDKTNLSTIQQSRQKRSSSQLLLEPGRILYPKVKGCSVSHKCSNLPMNNVIIRRTKDSMLVPDMNGKISGQFILNPEKGLEYIEISTTRTQNKDNYLIIGSLSDSDFQTEYKTEATLSYHSYIVNPADTIQYTSRELKGRIVQYLESGFYMTGTPDGKINGPIEITVKYLSGYFNKSLTSGTPTLLTWCEVEQVWVNVSRSCNGQYIVSVDWENNTFTTPLCDVRSICIENVKGSSKRKKRQTDNGYNGPQSFLVVAATKKVINDPPVVITDTTYTIDEDVGTITFIIAAGDPDNDEVIFMLDPNSTHRGTASLDPNGHASYKSCHDCFGTDEVIFIVREVRTDDIPVLETRGLIRIFINEVNDNPDLVFVQQGEAFRGVITQTVDQYQDSKFYNRLNILLVSYDMDLDSVSIDINGNKGGTLMLYSQPQASRVTYLDCDTDWGLRKEDWDIVKESILDQQDFTLPVPCGLEKEAEGKSLNWVATVVEYTPNRDFLGMDTVQVVSRDEHGLVSQILNFDVYVLANPCENNATCIGPSWDVRCTDISRINGFENYTCGCSPGFTGSVCEQGIDECLSSPCPTNYTCVDQTNSYQCICRDGWPCTKSGLNGWMIGVIAVTVILVLLLAAVILICIYKFISPRGKVEPWFDQKQQKEKQRPLSCNSKKRPRSADGRPSYATKVIHVAPWKGIHSKSSDHSPSNYDFVRTLDSPVSKQMPSPVGRKDSSARSSDCVSDVGHMTTQRRPRKFFQLRGSRSVSDLSATFEMETHA